MTTDDERRAVARRLRELPDDSTCPDLIGAIADHDGWYAAADAADRLADLIEPNRSSGGRTILCAHCESASWCGCEPGDEEGGCDFEPSVTEGEPPYNLYSLYEAVLRRHPRDESAIEDDEVEELVDALLDICNAPGHDVIQRPQPSCDRDTLLVVADELWNSAKYLNHWQEPFLNAREVRDMARRIREALGVGR